MVSGEFILDEISSKEISSFATKVPSFSANCFCLFGNIPCKVIPNILIGSFGWNSILIAIQLVNQPINAEIIGRK
jgi:hypothetical protein